MFKFRLETVLNARKAFEDKLLREFSEKKRELEKEKQVLETLKEERQQSIDHLKRMPDQTVTVAEIAMYTSYIEFLQGRVDYQLMVVSKGQDALEAKRQEVLEAVMKRKVMENLKERAHREYQANIELQERKALDEISLQGFSRRML
jgi:flagellar FliJ protein